MCLLSVFITIDKEKKGQWDNWGFPIRHERTQKVIQFNSADSFRALLILKRLLPHVNNI